MRVGTISLRHTLGTMDLDEYHYQVWGMIGEINPMNVEVEVVTLWELVDVF